MAIFQEGMENALSFDEYSVKILKNICVQREKSCAHAGELRTVCGSMLRETYIFADFM